MMTTFELAMKAVALSTEFTKLRVIALDDKTEAAKRLPNVARRFKELKAAAQ